MSALVEGDTVTVACPICTGHCYPWNRTCGEAECVRELEWRKTLSCLRKPYRLDPESRLGKLAAGQEAPPTESPRCPECNGLLSADEDAAGECAHPDCKWTRPPMEGTRDDDTTGG